MGIQIEGGNANQTFVGRDGRLHVESRTVSQEYLFSRDNERAYCAVFSEASVAAGEFAAFIRNDDTDRLLVVSNIKVAALNAATWKLHKVSGLAAGGTAVVPLNMNFVSGFDAVGTFLTNAPTGLTSAGEAAEARHAAALGVTLYGGMTLILAVGQQLAVEYDLGTTGEASVVIQFFYEALTNIDGPRSV